MPIAILLIGILLLVTVYKGNTTEVFAQVETDIIGDGKSSGFMLWAGAILFLAAAGSVLGLQKTGKLFIGLILAVFIIQQKGLWTQAENALSSAQKPAETSAVQTGQAVNALDQPDKTATATATADKGTNIKSTILSGVKTGSALLAGVLKGSSNVS